MPVARWGSTSVKRGASSPVQEWAEIAEAADAVPTPAVPAPSLKPKATAVEKSLKSVPTEVLAAELQSRGWVVLEP